MRRKGLKIVSIILTIISVLVLALSFEFIKSFIDGLGELKNDQTEGGIIAVLLFFFVIAFAFMFIILIGIGLPSLVSIILNSIDLSKTIKENGNIVFNIVFLSINFLFYTFVSGLVLILFV